VLNETAFDLIIVIYTILSTVIFSFAALKLKRRINYVYALIIVSISSLCITFKIIHEDFILLGILLKFSAVVLLIIAVFLEYRFIFIEDHESISDFTFFFALLVALVSVFCCILDDLGVGSARELSYATNIAFITLLLSCAVVNLVEEKLKESKKGFKALSTTQNIYINKLLKSTRFKDDFMASMSHELRTPLNVIIGGSELLLEKLFGELNEKQTEYVNSIYESGDRLLQMVENLLDISKIERGQLKLDYKEIQLDSLLKQIQTDLRQIYREKDIELSIISKADLTVFADPTSLKQIIYNILDNAFKYTNEGKVVLAIVESEKDWIFMINDTGAGMNEEKIKLLFSGFTSFKANEANQSDGIGLGLHLTKKLINLHGGIIQVLSKVGEGSTVTFNIPKKY